MTLVGISGFLLVGLSFTEYANAQQNLTTHPSSTLNVVTNNTTYVLVFEHRKVGNIDNNTKLVSAIVGNDSNKIKEELLEEISLAPSPELKQWIDKVIDDGIKGLPCEIPSLVTQEGISVGLNCITFNDKIAWFVYPIK
jgi:hypothetical protein